MEESVWLMGKTAMAYRLEKYTRARSLRGLNSRLNRLCLIS